MADKCTLQVVNCTSQSLVAGNYHEYQMDSWAFSTIGTLNYFESQVAFYDGHYDEDDGGEQNYQYGGSDLVQIQARSDGHSNHFLKVQALNTSIQGDGPIVLATNGKGTILTSLAPNDLMWLTMDQAGGTQTIGMIASNSTDMGLAVVDLGAIFSDPSEAQSYFNAISQDNLTYEQSLTLKGAVVGAIKPLVAVPGGVGG